MISSVDRVRQLLQSAVDALGDFRQSAEDTPQSSSEGTASREADDTAQILPEGIVSKEAPPLTSGEWHDDNEMRMGRVLLWTGESSLRGLNYPLGCRLIFTFIISNFYFTNVCGTTFLSRLTEANNYQCALPVRWTRIQPGAWFALNKLLKTFLMMDASQRSRYSIVSSPAEDIPLQRRL